MRKTVAVDLDGVLAHYDGWRGFFNIGDPLPGAQDFIRSLLEFAEVIIHTGRINNDPMFNGPNFDQGPEIIRGWLSKHEFPSGVQVWSGKGKPVASAYVDDRAVLCQPQSAGSTPAWEYLLAVSQCKSLTSQDERTGQPPTPEENLARLGGN